MKNGSNYEILGLGAPILDRLIRVDEAFIDTMPGRKGGMTPVDYPTIMRYINGSSQLPVTTAGGSCSNTIKGLASLGRRCALAGKIGSDEEAKQFLNNIETLCITPLYSKTSTPTGQVLCAVTPDGERTMLSYFGASSEMQGKDLTPAIFEGVKLVHIEGYSLMANQLTERAMALAKAAGAKISFDLASFEVTNYYKEIIINLLTRYVDIVFANAHETMALTHLGPEKGCRILKDLCDTVVVLMGKEGCWVGRGEEVVHCPAFTVSPIDSTGAGDLFASGFLHGYLAGRPMAECALYGSHTGGAVVQVVGAELSPEKWQELKLILESASF